MKVFIPTYNRPDSPTVIQYGQDDDFIFVLQDNDLNLNNYKVKNKIILENCKALAWKRNKIVDYCHNNNIRFCIQCDDNVIHFLDNEKNKIETKVALQQLETICKDNNFNMTTGCKNSFVFAGKPNQFGNGILFQAFCIDITKIKNLNFPLVNMTVFEDFIFSVECYQNRIPVSVCKWLSPVKQKVKGALSSNYTATCQNTQNLVGSDLVDIVPDKKFVQMIKLKKTYNQLLKSNLKFGQFV